MKRIVYEEVDNCIQCPWIRTDDNEQYNERDYYCGSPNCVGFIVHSTLVYTHTPVRHIEPPDACPLLTVIASKVESPTYG